ncbi:acyltransferase family protein [soil metagenome]
MPSKTREPTDADPAVTPEVEPSAKTRAPGFRVIGLDGVRAIAVVLVMLFHLSPGAVVGGYLGVDIFFVVSGFLITELLVRERDAAGRISLRGFWTRRARRLIPALIVLLLACCAAAYAIGGDVLLKLGSQVLGALTFSSNWLFIAGGSSYFDESTPELFRNLWSLAVEEQFYLVWPLLLALVLLRPKKWMRFAGVGLLAVASGVAMALLWDPNDATRVYYGTDTHAFGLAIGALLALVARHWSVWRAEWPRWTRRALDIAGPVAALGLVAIAILLPGDSPIVYRGGLVGVALLTAVVIASLLVPASPLAWLLELAPFRWVGKRSYGLYLWHWPVFVLVVAALPDWSRDGLAGWSLGGVALVITMLAAALSYRFVEQPIRRNGFRAAGRRFVNVLVGSRRGLIAATAAATLVLAGGTATIGAVTTDPGKGETQLLVEAGQAAIDAAIAEAEAEAASHTAQAGGTDPAEPQAAPQPVGGEQITAIGDSVMLAAAPTLQEVFPGIAIDAQVSRSIVVAPGMVQALLDAGQLRPVLLLALGTNGPIERDTLETIRNMIGPDRLMVVVNVQEPRSWEEEVNTTLSAFALYYRDVELANWHDAIQPSLHLLAGDQIHFGSAGAAVFAAAIKDALQRLAELPPLRDESADESLPRPV